MRILDDIAIDGSRVVSYRPVKRPLISALAAVLAIAVLSGAAAMYFLPLETYLAFARLRLRGAGAHRIRSAGLGAYERNDCRAGQPCRCIALIHGLGDSSMTWQAILTGNVPAGSRLVAVDLPGTEDSEPPKSAFGYDIKSQASAVRSSLEPLCPHWTIAGNSLGGWIAARLTLDWPNGVDRLILLNPAGLDDPSGTMVRAAMALAYPSVPQLKAFSLLAFAHPRNIPERAWRSSVELLLKRPVKPTFLVLSRADLLDRDAGRIRAPTLIVSGEKDGVVPTAVSRRYHELIGGSTLRLVPECGHLPHQECPDAVRRALFEP